MSKKFAKLLLGATVVGAAVGVLAYLNNKYNNEDDWDDDFDEFEDDFEEEDLDKSEPTPTANAREYVTIPTETPEAESKAASEEATTETE